MRDDLTNLMEGQLRWLRYVSKLQGLARGELNAAQAAVPQMADLSERHAAKEQSLHQFLTAMSDHPDQDAIQHFKELQKDVADLHEEITKLKAKNLLPSQDLQALSECNNAVAVATQERQATEGEVAAVQQLVDFMAKVTAKAHADEIWAQEVEACSSSIAAAITTLRNAAGKVGRSAQHQKQQLLAAVKLAITSSSGGDMGGDKAGGTVSGNAGGSANVNGTGGGGGDGDRNGSNYVPDGAYGDGSDDDGGAQENERGENVCDQERRKISKVEYVACELRRAGDFNAYRPPTQLEARIEELLTSYGGRDQTSAKTYMKRLTSVLQTDYPRRSTANTQTAKFIPLLLEDGEGLKVKLNPDWFAAFCTPANKVAPTVQEWEQKRTKRPLRAKKVPAGTVHNSV